METEKEFKEIFGKLSHDQLLDIAYNLKKEVVALQEKNSSLKRAMYGRRRENVHIDQLSLFNEAELVDENSKPGEVKDIDIPEEPTVKPKRGKNKNLKTIREKVIDIVMDNPVCDICGGKLDEIKPKVIKRLVYIPSQLYIEKTVVHQYVCHSCSEKEETMYIFQKEGYEEPRPLLKGSMASSSFVVNTAYKKLVMGVPFYRQEKDLNHNGIPVSRQVLCNWFMRSAEKYLKPVFDRMETDMRKADILNMDETTLQCLQERENGRESDSYEWLCMTNEYEKKQMALYYYKSDRCHSNVEEILGKEYQGIIQSDGYQAYENYSPAKGHAGCLSHARRKYEDALKSNTTLYKQVSRKGITDTEREELLNSNPSFAKALWFVQQYDKVFRIERTLKQSTPDFNEIVEIRNTKERPVLEEIHKEARELITKCAPSGKLYAAIQYTLNQWDALTYYLNDGRIPASNNIAEREDIKPFVTARKNFLFADTIHGAHMSSIWFSLMISSRMNKLNTEKYLTYVLDMLSSKEEITEDMIEKCLPYSDQLPKNLTV